jgi:hypothetical protein
MFDSFVHATLGSPPTNDLSVKEINLLAQMGFMHLCGFRKAEVAAPQGSGSPKPGAMTRASITYVINNLEFNDPSPAQLRALVAGGGSRTNGLMVQPPLSKCDPHGAHFCWQAISIQVRKGRACVVKLMAAAELASPCHGADRRTTAAFVRDTFFAPIVHADVEKHMRRQLLHIMDLAEALWYSPHSWRVGAATALLDAGVAPEMIQRMLRWRSLESVLLYARHTRAAYDASHDIIRRSSTRTRNVPHSASLPMLTDPADEFW